MTLTRIEIAKKGIITDEMKEVALSEGIAPERLASDLADGFTVIPRNERHAIKPIGIGNGLRTNINANIGTSKDRISFDEELKKLDVLTRFGADAVMDLSTGGPIRDMRRLLIEKSSLSVGTVPIYEAAVKAAEAHGTIAKMSPDSIFDVIEEQSEEGVDFITVHCGLTQRAVERLRQEGRILDIVSRGGSFLLEWMIYNDRENPLYAALFGQCIRVRASGTSHPALGEIAAEIREWVREVLRRGQRIGAVRTDLEEDLLLETSFGMMEGFDRWVAKQRESESETPIDDLAGLAVEFLRRIAEPLAKNTRNRKPLRKRERR